MSRNGNNKLPPGWVKALLGEISQPIRPRHNPQDWAALPFIGMEHIEAHTMRLLGTVPALEMKSSAVHFFPGDVLYGRLRPYLNKVYRPDFEGLCSAEFIVFPASEDIETKFIQYLLNSSAFVSFASHLNEGDRPRVDFAQISPYTVGLPPLAEQRRIVAKIEELFTKLDAGVAALKAAKKQLKRYRQSVLKAAVEGELTKQWREQHKNELEPGSVLLERILRERREKWEADQLAKMQAQGKPPKDDKWKAKYEEPASPPAQMPVAIPQSWCWILLDTACIVTKLAGFEFTKFVKYEADGDLPVIKAENVTKRGFIKTEFSKVKSQSVVNLSRSRLEPDNLLMVFVGVGLGQVGRVPDDQTYFLGPNVAVIRVTTRHVLPTYLELFLRSHVGYSLITSMSKATAQGSISMGQIRLVPFAVPLITEQEQIVAEVERRLSIADEIEATLDAELRRAERLRQSILKRAFEGKLVPQDPNDEPASVLLDRIKAEKARGKVKSSVKDTALRSEENDQQRGLF